MKFNKKGNLKIKADLKNVYNAFKKIKSELDFLGPLLLSCKLAFSEALRNAIEHGAQRDPKKTIKIDYQISDRFLKFVITDPGKGFLTSLDLQNADPLRGKGRGLILMKGTMDEVRFNKKGNQVTLIKYFCPVKEVR